MNGKKRIDTMVLVVAVIGGLVCVNIIGMGLPWRVDLTRGGEYTLSQATFDTLEGLRDPVTVRAYFTKNLPARLAILSRYIKDMLDEYYAHAGGNFRYEFIDPSDVETEEDEKKKKQVKRNIFGRPVPVETSVERELRQLGVQSLQVQVKERDKLEVKRVYMGVVVAYGDKKEVIPVVQGTKDFEYNLTTLIRKVSREQAPKVALIVGHENPDLQREMSGMHGLLQQLYEVTTVDLTKDSNIGDDVDAILVVGPRTPFSESEQRAIDRFVMSGRSAAFLLGPVTPDVQIRQANPVDHGLGDLLASYGVNIQPGLVLDTNCGTIRVSRQQGRSRTIEFVRYPFFIVPKSLKSDHPLTRGLGRVSFPFMGLLTLDEDSKGVVKGEVLVRSSENSWVQTPPYDLNPFQRWTSDMIGEQGQRDLMVTLAGAIPSHFAPAKKEEDSDRQARAENARLFVAGGHAFVQDQFMSKGNQALMLNLMDWLVMDEALLAVRSRGLDAAPLDELSDGTRNLVKYLNIIGLPIVFVGFGLVRWRMRESRRNRIEL